MHRHAWLKTIFLSVFVDFVFTKQSKTQSRVLGAKEMIQWEEELLYECEELRSSHSTHLRKQGILPCVFITSTLGGRDRRVAGACRSAQEQHGVPCLVRDPVPRE